MRVTKEELAKFSNCSVEDVDNALIMGFKFKTLSDAAYLIEDKKSLEKLRKEYAAFIRWKDSQK